jgi:peptide/nickel transport system substrate-binding protein
MRLLRMSLSKVISRFILILASVIVLSGCKGGNEPLPRGTAISTVQSEEMVDREDAEAEGAPVEGEATTLTPDEQDSSTTLVLVADEITTLEPYRMVRVHPDGSVASHLWDTLTVLTDDLLVEPHLAESWRLVNSFTWEFSLRQSITFHDGESFDAEAVRFSIERAQSMPGSLETFTEDVGLEQVEVVDEHTLRLTTRQPVANLPFHLAFLEIVPPVYYSETDPVQLAGAPVGSGPYRLDRWIPGEGVVLEAVPTYWKGVPALPRLAFQTVSLAEDRLEALRDGQADLVTDLSPMAVDQWDSTTSRLESIESTQRMLIGMRIEAESPLADKRVRQALNYGVNVKEIVDDWLGGCGERYGSWVNPPANNPELVPWPYDPARARDLLIEAGYQQGLTTTLHIPAGVYAQGVVVAEAIAQQLGEIGVTVKVEAVDWAVFVRQLLSDDVPPLFLLGLNSRGDGLEDLNNLSSAFAFNPTGWESESFEDALERARNAFNESSRSRLMNEAQAIAYEEAPWVWLWRSCDLYGVGQRLDWTPRRDGLVYLYATGSTSPESTE